MNRSHLQRRIRHFIRWAQRDKCFLCPFPLVLHSHIHHIISVKDCGPDHYLNLIGICPNHHGMLENLKRTKSPSTSIIGTDHSNMKQWLYKTQAAHAEYESLNADLKKVMNHFLAPYWSSRDDLCKIFEKPHEPEVKVRLARMVIDRDIELMNKINSMRPRIFFPEPTIVKPGCKPYDLSLTNDPDIQSGIDQVVSANLHNIGKEVYDIANAVDLREISCYNLS